MAESKCLDVCLLEMLKRLVQVGCRSPVPPLPLEVSEDFHDFADVTSERAVECRGANDVGNAEGRAAAASCVRTPQRSPRAPAPSQFD